MSLRLFFPSPFLASLHLQGLAMPRYHFAQINTEAYNNFQLKFISIFQLTFTAQLSTKPKVCSNVAGDKMCNKESGKMRQKSRNSRWS